MFEVVQEPADQRGVEIGEVQLRRLLAGVLVGVAEQQPERVPIRAPCARWRATANRAAADWYPLFPNPVVAESILDRLINTAHHLHMDGRSYRPTNRPGRPRKTGGATTG